MKGERKMLNENIIRMTLDEYEELRDKKREYYAALYRVLKVFRDSKYPSREDIYSILDDLGIGEFQDIIDEMKECDEE
jgi:hypothetical protein